MEFSDIDNDGEVEGASAPSADLVYDFEVYLSGREDPVVINSGSLTFNEDTDDLMIYGEHGAYTSFNWRYIEYYVARPVR